MRGSANEIAALATKAARGAGVPPALAAQFGKAVVHHLAAGHRADDLVSALKDVPNGPIYRLPAALICILEEGAGRYRRGRVPLSASAEMSTSYIQTLPFACTWEHQNDGIDLTVDTETPAPDVRIARLTLPDDITADWQSLAAKTFVPETAASRLAGAGAGLTDND